MTMIGNVNTNYIPQSFLNADGTIKPEKQAQAEAISAGVQARIGDMPEAEKQIFQTLIQSSQIDLTPSGELDMLSLDDMLDVMESAVTLVETLSESSEDAIDLLSRVMVEQAAQQRKDALEDRLQARETAKSQLMDQAGEMKNSAEKLRSGAIAALVLTVVMSAISIAGSIASLKGAASAGKQLKGMSTEGFDHPDTGQLKLTQHNFEIKKIDIGSTRSGIYGTLGQMANSLGQGTANFASAESQSESKEAEARGSVDAAQAQDSQAIADTKKEVQQALDDMIKSIIAFLKELKDAKAEMARAFTKV
jgi:hypothetical protein